MDVSQNINLEKLISLFKKMKNGDLVAFESFYNLTYKIVYYKLLTYIKNEEVIKDLSQDIYLVFFKNLKEIKNDEACIKFLFVITKNKALDYLKTYKEMYEYNDNLFIFGGNKPISPSTINRRKLMACKKSNVRPITLHQFRHSHATFLLNNGIPITEVSRRLGHGNVSTTLNVYCHSDLTQEKRVLATLNSIRFNYFSTMKYKFKSILKRIFRSNN